MSDLVGFLEPSALLPWLGRTVLLILLTYTILWLVSLILSRLGSRESGDPVMQAYLGLMVPTGFHFLFWASILVGSLARFQGLGLSSWYGVPYTLPVILDGALVVQLAILMRQRRSQVKSSRGDV